jgi:uncharacterized protein with PIN domain
MTRFLCDEMLARLGRWLRAAGYDTAIAAPGEDDGTLVARCVAEDRLLLSRDARMAERRAAAGRVVLLTGQSVDGWAQQLTARCGVDWLAAPFSRCLIDNTLLQPHPQGAAAAPPSARTLPGPVMQCPGCRRTYWPGSHARRIRTRLERWHDDRCS